MEIAEAELKKARKKLDEPIVEVQGLVDDTNLLGDGLA